jgi:oxaloacetate decarboxylase (Na+ extruding) subunit alpha
MAVGLIDTTIRDGNQSLWATRMPTAAFLPILPVMDEVGYASIEILATVHMDVCVRYLKENPWERLRLIRERVRRTPLRMLSMSQFFSISGVMSDDVVELFTACVARAGVDIIWVTPSLNDIRNGEVAIRAGKQLGLRTEGSILYTISPVHTDEYFAGKARELCALGVDALILKDAGGLLTPERARTLVPALVEAAGGLDVYCHSHCITGLGPAANLEAVKGGASALWTSTPALANGSSVPSDESMARHLGWMGYELAVDRERMSEVSSYFRALALRHGKQLGKPAEYDPAYYEHHMPGGMLGNFRAQLIQLGLEDRLDEILEEMPQVRRDLGWPNSMTPFSQFIATQALLNVLYGRYEVVPDEVRKLALGYWGTTPAPVDPNVLDKVGRGREPVTARAGELVPPILDRVRAEQGPFASDEDLLLAVLFMPGVLAEMRAAGPVRLDDERSRSWVVDLVRDAAARPSIRCLHISAGGAG